MLGGLGLTPSSSARSCHAFVPCPRSVRRCRRLAAQREAVRKNKEAIEAHRRKKEGGAAPEPEEPDLAAEAAAYGIVGGTVPPGESEAGPLVPPPVSVNPAFLPVDAYHGCPPRRFEL